MIASTDWDGRPRLFPGDPGEPSQPTRKPRRRPEVWIVKMLFAGLVTLVLFGVSCGDEGPKMGSPGAFGGTCKADGTCDAGLQCVDHVCKDG